MEVSKKHLAIGGGLGLFGLFALDRQGEPATVDGLRRATSEELQQLQEQLGMASQQAADELNPITDLLVEEGLVDPDTLVGQIEHSLFPSSRDETPDDPDSTERPGGTGIYEGTTQEEEDILRGTTSGSSSGGSSGSSSSSSGSTRSVPTFDSRRDETPDDPTTTERSSGGTGIYEGTTETEESLLRGY